uniref:Flp family type IVb pilin n=1 Tax=Thaumasiovibrio occultus TaxID=1891184 RepID=UPI000B35FD93|nr:Flp family type IVb pilin [Thaumasiovibrio occultus]
MFDKATTKFISLLEAFKQDQRGVTAIEYAVIAVAVAAVVIAVFGVGDNPLQGALENAISDVSTQIDTQSTP